MADAILNVNDGTPNVRAGSLGGASMRYHELAIQRWLNGLFYVREGYPVPVVFTSPMDAFSYFGQLWADENNPFAYLLDLKDSRGTPLYEPHPSPVRYPVISVHRKSWKYRSYQNFSIHRWRHINWPTVSNAGSEYYGPEALGWDLTKCKLGNVTTSRMPMAWDYRFQIDHFCNRPDTQAFFIEQLMQEFWRTGGTPQTWITVPYPGWGNRRVRLYLDGDIESLTPEEPEDGKNAEFRTSFTVVVEGFDVDLRYKIYPALWEIIFRLGPVAPITLAQAFYGTYVADVRIQGSNSSIDSRPNIPSWGTCQEDLEPVDQTTIQMVSLNETANNQFGVFTVGTLPFASMQNAGTTFTSFSSGSYTLAVLYINAYGTDSGTNSTVFLAGALEQFIHLESGALSDNVYAGTYQFTVINAGSFNENGTLASVFSSGSYMATIVNAGSIIDAGTTAAAISAGTYALTSMSAGSYVESGTNTTVYLTGTYAQMVMVQGPFIANGSLANVFLNGTYV